MSNIFIMIEDNEEHTHTLLDLIVVYFSATTQHFCVIGSNFIQNTLRHLNGILKMIKIILLSHLHIYAIRSNRNDADIER